MDVNICAIECVGTCFSMIEEYVTRNILFRMLCMCKSVVCRLCASRYYVDGTIVDGYVQRYNCVRRS